MAILSEGKGKKAMKTETYRGFEILTSAYTSAVGIGGSFYGSYATLAAARRRVDEIITRSRARVEKVEMSDGRIGYRYTEGE